MRKPKKDHHALSVDQQRCYKQGFGPGDVVMFARQAHLELDAAAIDALTDTLNWWRRFVRKSTYEPEPGKVAVPERMPKDLTAWFPLTLRMAEPENVPDMAAAIAVARTDRALALAGPLEAELNRLSGGKATRKSMLKFIVLAVPALCGETITSPEAVRVHLIRARKHKS